MQADNSPRKDQPAHVSRGTHSPILMGALVLGPRTLGVVQGEMTPDTSKKCLLAIRDQPVGRKESSVLP